MIDLKAPMVRVRIEARHLVLAALVVAVYFAVRHFGLI